MVSRKHYYHSIQRQSRCKDHIYVLDTIRAAGMDETYGTYVDDECFDMHDHDDTDDDTDDDTEDDTNDDTNDDTDDGARGQLYIIKFPGWCSWVPGSCCLSCCIPKNTRQNIIFRGDG